MRAAVAGESTELELALSRMTRIPEGVFSTLTVLTKLYLGYCASLTALPESMGQLVALQELDGQFPHTFQVGLLLLNISFILDFWKAFERRASFLMKSVCTCLSILMAEFEEAA